MVLMKPEIKTKWLAALRSGKYKQGKGCLRSGDDKFCCLGVLLDVVAPKGWLSSFHSAKRYHRSSDSIGELPTASFARRARLPCGILKDLAAMNDNGTRFTTIAKYIEKNL